MRIRSCIRASYFMICMNLAYLCLPLPLSANILYKHYAIKEDQGTEILCDPYVVQQDDYVFKIFRQKGEIALQNLDEFLEIFIRLNPHIRNIHRIHPGQHILIPLKKLPPDTFPQQSSGSVTIPFITISNIQKMLAPYIRPHVVQPGEFISKLLYKDFGSKRSAAYKQALQIFQLLNPDIADLNLIFVGQRINLVQHEVQSQTWYQALFDASGNIKMEIKRLAAKPPTKAQTTQALAAKGKAAVARLAAVMEAKLYQKGSIFFPMESGKDIKIDLSRTPLIKLDDKTRLLFVPENEEIPNSDFLQSFWKNIKIIPTSGTQQLEDLLAKVLSFKEADGPAKLVSVSDHGLRLEVRAQWVVPQTPASTKQDQQVCITVIKELEESTHPSISKYLGQRGVIIREILNGSGTIKKSYHRGTEAESSAAAVFVAKHELQLLIQEIVQGLGYLYSPNTAITFTYLGMQIEAVSNLVSIHDGRHLFVDFGTFYGDALAAIHAAGLDVIQVIQEEDLQTIIQKLLSALNVAYTTNPIFYAARRSPEYNTSLTIPGHFISKPNRVKMLVTRTPLKKEIIQFLQEKGLNRIIMVQNE